MIDNKGINSCNEQHYGISISIEHFYRTLHAVFPLESKNRMSTDFKFWMQLIDNGDHTKNIWTFWTFLHPFGL